MTKNLSFALLLVRAVLGVVMFAHGMQKLTEIGIPGVQGMLAGIGVPAPELLGTAMPYVEIAVGVMLVVGLGTRIAGIITAAMMAVATFGVHLGAGFFAANGGYELTLVLAVVALALAFSGPGSLALDAPIRRRSAKD